MASMTTTGTTENGASWHFAKEKSIHYFVFTSADGVERKERVSLAETKKLTAAPENFLLLMEILSSLNEDGHPYLLRKFSNLKRLTSTHREWILELEDPWERMAALLLCLSQPKTDKSAVHRVARIQAQLRDERNSVDSYYLDLHVTVQRTTLQEWLDVWDFLVNGDKKECFRDFNAVHAGRVFTVPYGVQRRSYNTQIFYRQDELKLYRSNLATITHRFIQLSKRSQKLKRKLHTMPLEKVVQALDFNLPGTLLVNDTIELIDVLKHIRLRDEVAHGYGTIDSSLGVTIANQARRAKVDQELQRYLGHQYESRLIRDAYGVWDRDPALASFVAFAARRLGVKETLSILKTVETETDGVTMRGWMELVRMGGFPSDKPAGWTALMLADK